MRKIAIFTALVVGTLLFSCKKPSPVALPGFKNIVINGAMNVTFTSGSSNAITHTSGLTVTTAVVGNSLVINGTGSASVSINNVDSVFSNGASTISNSGNINLNHLYIQCNGTTSFTMNNLNVRDSLDVTLNGSGTYTFTGSSPVLKVFSNGAGMFAGYGFTSTTCMVFINGTGSAQVYVTTFLSGIINGAGYIYYKGNPTQVIPLYLSGTGQLIKI